MHLFFPTPIWISEIINYEDINKELIKFIYEEQDLDPKGKNKSNVKGWHSKPFDLKNQSLNNFLKSISVEIEKATIDMGWDVNNQVVKITSMWSIINKKDSFNERHHHGNSSLSAAYYVNANKDSGDIVFYDPRQAFAFSHPEANKINDLNAQVKSVTPKSGTLVLFPSYLDHSVKPSKSEEDRVVISFNISLIPKRFL
tara:strand:- start:4073 stop:4669 length:597 start_codon:yes stop_codon:yes gene_type:complete